MTPHDLKHVLDKGSGHPSGCFFQRHAAFYVAAFLKAQSFKTPCHATLNDVVHGREPSFIHALRFVSSMVFLRHTLRDVRSSREVRVVRSRCHEASLLG